MIGDCPRKFSFGAFAGKSDHDQLPDGPIQLGRIDDIRFDQGRCGQRADSQLQGFATGKQGRLKHGYVRNFKKGSDQQERTQTRSGLGDSANPTCPYLKPEH